MKENELNTRPGKNADSAWTTLVDDLCFGDKVAPRGIPCFELIGYQSIVDMRYPVLTVGDRKLGRKFQAAEAAWILSGDNKVSTISPYSKAISNFSDDGQRFFGAYGPKIQDQISYAVDAIVKDPDTRQSVINIWRENPRQTKDVPCTINTQFMVRDGVIHCNDTMRSSDAWLGWPYDIFNFTMLTAYVALSVREVSGTEYGIGDLRLTAGSQHLYEKNLDEAKKILAATRSGEAQYDDVPAFDPMRWFDSPEELVDWLWVAAGDQGIVHAMKRKEAVYN